MTDYYWKGLPGVTGDAQSGPVCKSGNELRRNSVPVGTCEVTPVAITKMEWSKKELIVDEIIEAQVTVEGIDDGEELLIEFFERDGTRQEFCHSSETALVQGGQARIAWRYPTYKQQQKGAYRYSSPSIYFTAEWYDTPRQKSKQIPIYTDLNIKVQKEDGTAIAEQEVHLQLSNGRHLKKKTDASGKLVVKKLPPRAHKIKFPGAPRIIAPGNTTTDFNPEPQEMTVVAAGSTVMLFTLIDLYAYCLHKIEGKQRAVCNTSKFEVVPAFQNKDDYKDVVTILSRTAANPSCNGVALEKLTDVYGMHAFLLTCKQDHKWVAQIWKPSFWTGLKKPDEYQIAGLPKAFTVACYRPDRFKLQLQFPPLRTWSAGTPIGTKFDDIKKHVNIKNAGGVVTGKVFTPAQTEGFREDGKFPTPANGNAPITLFRNGTELQQNFFEVFGAVIELVKSVNGIVQKVQENVPKVGWYAEVENKFLQGTFVLEWGWKEYKDHRAFYYMGLNINLKILEVKFEIGIGVSGFCCKLQLFGALAGSVEVSAKLCRVAPEGNPELSIPFAAEIKGMFGLRAQLGYAIKAEGTVETGFKINDGAFKFFQSNGCSLEAQLEWTGITAKFVVSGGKAKAKGTETKYDPSSKKEYVHNLVDPIPVKTWNWPKPAEPYNPPIIPAETLHKMVVKMLKKKDIEVLISKGEWYEADKEYSTIEVAKDIEKIIHARSDLQRDEKSTEALLFKITDCLELRMKSENYLSMSSFESFMESTELKGILDSCVDPIQAMLNENS